MIIAQIEPEENYQLRIFAEDGRTGLFDVSPYLKSEAFTALKDEDNFSKIHNGKYFIEWDCGADLSADTIESKWKIAFGEQ
jgi:hypothetical protein